MRNITNFGTFFLFLARCSESIFSLAHMVQFYWTIYTTIPFYTIKKMGVRLNLFKAQLKKPKFIQLHGVVVWLLVFLAKNSHYLIYWTQSSETYSLHGTVSQLTFYLHHVMDFNCKLFLDIKDGPKVPIYSNHYLNSWLMGSKLESCYFTECTQSPNPIT